MLIRQALPEDAEAIAALLIRSIRELCGPDYDNDERILSAWCANKTPENMRRGIENPNNYWIVAIDDEVIAGTALMTSSGEIHLCYLLPEYVGRGIGTAMLNNLLHNARVLGLRKVTLESTRTARAFYKRNGFIETAPVLGLGIIPSFAMERDLTSNDA
ncbi:MAG TPA: GNAT family N-acetyltransferase [Candidatus Kapabacteria bacterium]|nr:GNAT family N-acetyltransferase [Candidatus Kapabacteria bacterium]